MLFNLNPTLYNGGDTSQIAVKNFIGDAVLSTNALLYYLNGYFGVYVVTSVHLSAAKMNGNKRETSDAVRYGLNVALAVSKPLKAVQLITPYNSQLTALDIQHQQIRNSNAYWINSTWGPGSAVGAKAEISSILHLDLSHMKLL